NNDFTRTNPSSTTLQPGDSTPFQVTFTPNARGSRAATFTVQSSSYPSASVDVSGTGIDRRLSADRPTVSFGNQRVKTRSPTQTLSLVNSGGDPVTVTSVARHGANGRDFVVSAPAVPFTIAGQHARVVTVAFQPSATGLRSGAVEFVSNACGSPNLRVGLVGTGVVPNISVDPNPIDLGASPSGVQSPATAATVTNDGEAPLKVTAVQITG